MFKTELHLHTAGVSRCASATVRQAVDDYINNGYDTIIITNHLSPTFFKVKVTESMTEWKDIADFFMSDYREAKEYAAGRINVLLGMELRTRENINDYLVYGITEDFIKNNPELYESSYEKFYPIAKENGFLVIQAHALRDGVCNPTLEFVDGLEIYNSNPRHEDYNDKVTAIAKEHNLLFTAGSDAHRADDAALSGLYSEAPIETVEDFIALVKSGKAEIIRG
jgi:hypothetical protein